MPLSPAAARRGVDVSLALDVLRGLAAISMVVNHVAVQLLARADFHGAAALATFAASGAPVLFFFATGFAGALRRPGGSAWGRLDTVACLVAADLLAAWRGHLPWLLDFFTFIALSTLAVDLLARQRRAVALALGAALVLALLRFGLAPLALPWSERIPPLAWVLGFPGVERVSYPLTPWLCYPLLGFVLGRWCATRREPPSVPRALAAFAAGSLAALALGRLALHLGLSDNRWTTMGAAYFVLSFAMIGFALWVAVAAAAAARPLAAALSLRGVSAYAVVPIHFLLIQAAHEGRFDGLPSAGFALAAASIALAALVLAKGFAALLGRAHAAGPTTLRAATGALLLACALGLWALPAVHRLAFESQALVTLGQLALGAWLLRAPRRRPAVAVA